MKMLEGKNKSFKVVWDCNKQSYLVYKDGKYLITKYCYSDIKSYLN